MSARDRGGRPFFAPEVIQTSAMDCGPAALKCLLEGHGIRASYARLREACQTAVDGTSIDALETLAGQLGLEVEQITLPVENLLLAESAALPALVVVTLPSGLTHFLVVWRVHGAWVQVMDPARGRRWMRASQLLSELYVHENRVDEAAFREWAESDGFRDPLCARLRALSIAGREALVASALQKPGWRGIAGLDAAVRATEALLVKGTLARAQAPEIFAALHRATATPNDELVGERFWAVRAAESSEVTVRGAVALRVLGTRDRSGDEPLPDDVDAVVSARDPAPSEKLIELLRADGLWRWPALLLGLFLAAGGAVFEALLFRGVLDVGRKLALVEQRLMAAGAMLVLVVALFCVEWPAWRGLWGIGRRLEVRLRRAFVEKIPRVGDRYFQSRPVSDMAERAHLVHWLRLLPGQGGQLVRAVAELVVTVAGIIWLDPRSAPLALALAATTLAIPLLFQPALVERDLRMRGHAGGLARFYLDALMGLVPIRAHAGEEAIKREHGERLGEWARAARAGAKTTVVAEAVQTLLGFALAAALLVHYLVTAPGSGWALLLVYWALSLPVLGQEIGFLIQQYPQHRNVTLRLLEPLGAPEAHDGESGDDQTVPGTRRPGVELRWEGVSVSAAGREILTIGDLEIAAGQHVAIVGASGGGKSSLVGVLLGWHQLTAGQVRVDGQRLTGSVLARLRRETVWIDPAVYLWNRSLLDNLRYGSAPTAALDEAIEAAELDEVLGRLATGLQTSLGEAGGLLSGGEGQRVRIGRGLMRATPRLVILDEAFRGLERRRRSALLRRARERWKNATFLCITHDIADTAGFDRVLVVANGGIAEDAAPPALLAAPASRYVALLETERRLRARFSGAEWKRLAVVDGVVRELASDEAGS